MPVHSRYACRRLVRSEHAISSYTQFIDPNVTMEDILTASFWINVLPGLRLHDVVNVIAMDGSFEATMRIIRLGPGFIDFRILNEWRPPIDETSGRFEIGWAGPKAKWFVREVASGKKVTEGLEKAAATAELQRLDGVKKAA